MGLTLLQPHGVCVQIDIPGDTIYLVKHWSASMGTHIMDEGEKE